MVMQQFSARRVLIAAALLGGAWIDGAWAQGRRPAADTKEVAFSLAGAKALFKRVDKDADGSVNASEAPSAGLGPRDINAADSDKSGKLSENEFLVALHGSLTASGKAVEKDFGAEVAKLRASAKPAAGGAGTPAAGQPARESNRQAAPAAAPVARPATPATPAETLDRKIDEALRKAEADAAAQGERPRTVRTGEPTGTVSGLDGLSQEAQEALTRRLRNSGVTPDTAASERQALQARIENAQEAAAKKAAAGAANPSAATPATPANPAAGAAPQPRPEAGRAAVKAPTGASGATPANPAQPPNPAGAADAEAKAAAAMARLEQRLKNTNATPEQAAEARRELQARIDKSKKGGPPLEEAEASDAEDAPKGATPEERARILRANLEKRLKNTNATEEEAKAAREKLEQRLKNTTDKPAEGGADAAPAGGKRGEGAAPGAGRAKPKDGAPTDGAKAKRGARKGQAGQGQDGERQGGERQGGAPAARPAPSAGGKPAAPPAARPQGGAKPAGARPGAPKDDDKPQKP
jgi:hypothetical protein